MPGEIKAKMSTETGFVLLLKLKAVLNVTSALAMLLLDVVYCSNSLCINKAGERESEMAEANVKVCLVKSTTLKRRQHK